MILWARIRRQAREGWRKAWAHRHSVSGRGFRLVAVHLGAIDAAHTLKPSISLIGRDGIEIHDAIALNWRGEPR